MIKKKCSSADTKVFAVDIEKFDVSDAKEEMPFMSSSIFLILLVEIDPNLLILYVNKSLMRASDVTKEMDGFNCGLNQLKHCLQKNLKSYFMRQILIALMKITQTTVLEHD